MKINKFFKSFHFKRNDRLNPDMLHIYQEDSFTYVLTNENGDEFGIIQANYYDSDYIEIVRFCVAKAHRNNSEKRWGRSLIDHLIAEALSIPDIERITVVPKAEELYDDIEQIDLSVLYQIYERLGFKFINGVREKDYGNKMVLRLRQ